MKTRDITMDAVRSLAILFVVMIHIAVCYQTPAQELHSFGENYWLGNLLNSFSRIGVPLFVMLSGRFLMNEKLPISIFYKKRFKRILIPLVASTILYTIFLQAGYYFFEGGFHIQTSIEGIMTGRPYSHLWFLYMLLGLYLISPFLQEVKGRLSNRDYKLFVLASVGLSLFLEFYDFYFKNETFFLFWGFKYMSYFLLGDYLKDNKTLPKTLLAGTYIASSLLISYLNYVCYLKYESLFFHKDLSPLVMISSVVFYLFFCQMNFQSKLWSKFADLSFGIYILHGGILLTINKLMTAKGIAFASNPILDLVIFFVIVVVSSLILTLILKKTKYLKHLV